MTQNLVLQALKALKDRDYAAAHAAITAYGRENKFDIQHFLIKGLSEIALCNWQAAKATFEEATRAYSHQPQLWFNLGIAQENVGQWEDAANSYEHALELDPKLAEAYGNLSNVYRKLGRFKNAEIMAYKAYESGADKSLALNSLGLALQKQGKYAQAEKAYRDGLNFQPENPDILGNLANLAVDQLAFDQAWLLYAEASRIRPSAIRRRDEGMARLLAGDYVKGWPLYEARLELPTSLRIHPSCPLYDGQNIQGKKLLLLAEQGYGDTIMFCRYGKYFADQGAKILWMVQAPLHSLLKDQLPGQVYAEGEVVPEADYYLPLMSLPLATGWLVPPQASQAPYLRANKQLPLAISSTRKKRIGLVWAGSATHERNHERSLSLHQFEPVWTNIDAEYFAFAKGIEVKEITFDMPLKDLADDIHDFADTAAYLTYMDCVVSVDTAIAHLAGSLDIPTYLLLPHCPDWRWGTHGETTNWYSSLTLLRQPAYGDWDSVLDMLCSRLSNFIK